MGFMSKWQMAQWYDSLIELTRFNRPSPNMTRPSNVPSFIETQGNEEIEPYIYQGDNDDQIHQDTFETAGCAVGDKITETVLLVPFPGQNELTQFDSPLSTSPNFQSSLSSKSTSTSGSLPSPLTPPPRLQDRPLLLSPRY